MGAGAGAAGFSAPVPVNLEKPNTGIILLREVFDGGLPASGLVEWYEEHLTEDFQAVFAGGAATVTLGNSTLTNASAVTHGAGAAARGSVLAGGTATHTPLARS